MNSNCSVRSNRHGAIATVLRVKNVALCGSPISRQVKRAQTFL
jgi:hypothetical protein